MSHLVHAPDCELPATTRLTTSRPTAEHPAPLHVARQPIFDRAGAVIGYELLYRTNEGVPGVCDPEQATATVLLAGLAELGLDRIVGRRPAFINVTREMLLEFDPLPLPPDRVVLELLEDQLVDAALLEVLGRLTRHGFRIALDDFVLTPESAPLLRYASVVKLDVQGFDQPALEEQVDKLRHHDVTLLAEKVETPSERAACLTIGFDWFQGYYFAKPVLLSTPSTPTRSLRAIAELLRAGSSLTFEQLEAMIARDAGLSHRFLRLVNSAHYTTRSPVGSIQEGLARLGTIAVRRWAMVMVLARLADRPGYLLTLGLQRARA